MLLYITDTNRRDILSRSLKESRLFPVCVSLYLQFVCRLVCVCLRVCAFDPRIPRFSRPPGAITNIKEKREEENSIRNKKIGGKKILIARLSSACYDREYYIKRQKKKNKLKRKNCGLLFFLK